jgi:hypothetical protein
MADETTGASGQSGGSSEPGSASSGGRPEPGAASSGAKTYSQEQVDGFLAGERKRWTDRYGDYETIKARVKELEGASQSDLEKANAKLAEAVAHADKAAARADALQIRMAVVAEAARAGAIDPDVVVALLADQLSVKDGEVEGNVPKLVTKLLEERPYLKSPNGTRTIGSADGGTHGSRRGQQQSSGETMDDLLRNTR